MNSGVTTPASPRHPPVASPPDARGTSVTRLALRFNAAVCAAVLAAILSYCAAEDGMLPLASFSIGACVIGWVLGRGITPRVTPRHTPRVGPTGIPRVIPRWTVNGIVVIAIVHAAWRVVGLGQGSIPMGTPIVSVLAQFLVYIQIVKLLDRRSPRDEGHLLGLSVFIAIGAILTSNQLLVGALLLVYTPLAIASAMMLQVLGGHRRAEAAAANEPATTLQAPEHVPHAQRLVAGRTYRRDIRLASTLAIFFTVLLALFAFVVTPRGMGQDLLGSFGRVGGGSQVGFTDAIQLGGSGTLQQDATPVLSVKVMDASGQDIGDQFGSLYLRGAVRNRYNRSTKAWEWGRDRNNDPLEFSESRPLDPVFSGPWNVGPNQSISLVNEARATGVIRQTITMRKPYPKGGYLFASWRPIRIVGMSRVVTIGIPGREVILRIPNDNDEDPLSYTIESAAEYVDQFEVDRPPPQFQDERIREIAEGLLTARGVSLDPAQREPDAVRRAASGIQDYLRNNCEYSTQMFPPDEGEDPIDMFLFRTKSGHCEYFASAFVAMCQSVGIHSRIVAGYLAVEYDGASTGYLVRESNAHAWAEVRLARGRWQRFDPSPPDAVSRQHKPGGGLLSRIRKLYEAINFTWTDSVVSFDRLKQVGIVSSDGSKSSALADLYKFFQSLDPRRSLRGLSRGRLAGWLALGASLLVLLWVLARSVRNASRHRLTRQLPLSALFRNDPELRLLFDQIKFHERLERVLRRARLERPRHTPPLSHARTVAARQDEAGRDTAALAALYYRVRFGHHRLTESELAEAHKLVTRVESALTKHPRPGKEQRAPHLSA